MLKDKGFPSFSVVSNTSKTNSNSVNGWKISQVKRISVSAPLFYHLSPTSSCADVIFPDIVVTKGMVQAAVQYKPLHIREMYL